MLIQFLSTGFDTEFVEVAGKVNFVTLKVGMRKRAGFRINFTKYTWCITGF